MKKRKLAAVLALAVALTVAGCGDKKESTQENTKTETQDTKTETDEATEDITKDAEGHVVAVDVDDISKYVTLGVYKNLEVEVTKSQVTDESVEQYIQQQLSYQPVEVTEDRPVQENDTVNIDYTGYMDGEAFEGGTATDTDLIIGSGQFIDGFESGLIGKKKGEEVTLDLNFPDPYQKNPDLAGKAVQFKVKINKISEPAELTDAWVAENTDLKTADEYKAEIKASLTESAEMEYKNTKKSNLFQALVNVSTINEYPDELVEKAKKIMEKRFETSYAEPAGMTLEEYWEAQDISQEDADKIVEQSAKSSLEQGMYVQALLDAEGVVFTQEDYEKELDAFAKEYGFADAAALKAVYSDAELVKDNVLWSKSCEILEKYAKITEVNAEN